MSAMRLLVSVRSVDEALFVAACDGVDLIDLKEPRRGALGDLPAATLRAIVAALRAAGCTRSVSATIGDAAPGDLDAMLARVDEVAACGVDLVKVGVDPMHREAPRRLDALAGCGHAVVPVFLADRGWDFGCVQAAARHAFPALMADTGDKRAGSLFDRCRDADLCRFVETARAAGRPVGLAGSLQPHDLPALRRLGPDFAGFRSAVCRGDRSGALDPARLGALVAQARAVAATA